MQLLPTRLIQCGYCHRIKRTNLPLTTIWLKFTLWIVALSLRPAVLAGQRIGGDPPHDLWGHVSELAHSVWPGLGHSLSIPIQGERISYCPGQSVKRCLWPVPTNTKSAYWWGLQSLKMRFNSNFPLLWSLIHMYNYKKWICINDLC